MQVSDRDARDAENERGPDLIRASFFPCYDSTNFLMGNTPSDRKHMKINVPIRLFIRSGEGLGSS